MAKKAETREHALLSASGAHRWLVCTPSPRLEEALPDTTSENAAKGTLAHSIGELKLRKRFTPMGPRKFSNELKKLKEDPQFEEEMLKDTDEYAEYIESVVHSFDSPPHIVIEKRLDYSPWAPEGFGTGDCIIIGDDVLYVIDYKNGHRKVEAEDNAQMRLYALGAYQTYGILYPIRRVKMVIFQPKADGADEWEQTIDEILKWGEEIKPAAQAAFEGTGEYQSGEHCIYCRAKALCRARAAFNTEIEPQKGTMPPVLTDEEVGALLTRGRDLAAWVKALEEYALSQCLAGNEIPGWKAVEGRSDRKWSDGEAAFKALADAGIEEAVLYDRKPLTLAQVEKQIGKAQFNETVGRFVTRPPGKPTLAPADDKREAVTDRITPQEAFGSEENGGKQE